MNFDNALRRQVFSLPGLIAQQYRDLEPKTRKIFTTPEIFGFTKIILTGCGDSHAASMAAKYAFEALTRIPTEVVPAIELSRYYPEEQLNVGPNSPLVIAVSNSGMVSRVAEALARATKHGALTLGITGRPESPLGKSVNRVLELSIPPFESAPGTRTYMVTVMCLLLLAIRIGEVRGKYAMDDAMSMRKDMPAHGEMLAAMLPDMDKGVLEIAHIWKNLEAYDFVGAGPDYAAAWFGQAKIFEAVGKYAMHINCEEWLHLNFFMRNNEGIGTIVATNTESPARSRVREMVGYAMELKRPLLVLTDGDGAEYGEATCISVPKSKYIMNMALTQYAPICLLAGYIAEMIGEVDGRGCQGPWEIAAGARCIRQSETIIL